METSNCDIENIDYLYKESAKAVKIYEMILDKNNLDLIHPSQIETQELNNINCTRFNEYIKIIEAKKDETKGKINDFTNAFKNIIYVLISDIVDELEEFNEIKNYENLFKLSSYYYLYKIITANFKSEENYYMIQIDFVVKKIVLNKDCYYKILMHLGEFEEDLAEKNKNEKLNAYFKILFFLNEKMLSEELTKFMDNKKQIYKQYNIPLPLISFNIKQLQKNLEKIYNILFILKKTENFKTNERFEYFNYFRYKHEFLEEINYILYHLNKKPLVSLDKVSDDIAEEAFKYSLEYNKSNISYDICISELEQIIENAQKKQEEYKKKKQKLKEEYDKIFEKYNKLSDVFISISKEYKKTIDERKKITKEYNECNEKFNSLEQDYTKDLFIL